MSLDDDDDAPIAPADVDDARAFFRARQRRRVALLVVLGLVGVGVVLRPLVVSLLAGAPPTWGGDVEHRGEVFVGVPVTAGLPQPRSVPVTLIERERDWVLVVAGKDDLVVPRSQR